MKILSILGARPQFIKASSVYRAIERKNNKLKKPIKEILIHTGQHFDKNMSEVFFKELQIKKPDYNLNISNLTHGEMTGAMISKIEPILLKEKPDIVLIYGDTNSTLAGAISASKLGIPIAHIEAGLRSFNFSMPEEINRIVADRLSKFLLCPSKIAEENLSREGYPNRLSNSDSQVVMNFGDVMYDACRFYSKLAEAKIDLNKWSLKKEGYILCTIHRQENTDDIKKLTSLLSALNNISKDFQVVIPLHPRTKKLIPSIQNLSDQIKLIEPVPYLQMQKLIRNSKMIITDSGGLQKEAFFHMIPCITTREETEWIETVELGVNKLVGTNKKKILDAYHSSFDMGNFVNPYGDGKAAEKIIDFLVDY